MAPVLNSTSRKKLIVAGPGAGKTTLFRKLLEQAPGGIGSRLVLTFINNLKKDLDRELGGLAAVHTLHGYCQYLLRQSADLRGGLPSDFICHPGLAGLIKRDWGWINDAAPPKFVDLMRSKELPDELRGFYLARSDFYRAVDFDDSVYRVATMDSARAARTSARGLSAWRSRSSSTQSPRCLSGRFVVVRLVWGAGPFLSGVYVLARWVDDVIPPSGLPNGARLRSRM